MKQRTSAVSQATEERLERAFRAFLAHLPDRVDKALGKPRFRNIHFFEFFLGKIEWQRQQSPTTALVWAKVAVRLASSLGNVHFSAALGTLSAVHLAMGQNADAERVHRLSVFVDPAHAERQYLLQLARARQFELARNAALRALMIAQGMGKEQAKGRALVNLGVVHEMAGDHYEASCRFMDALQSLTFKEDETAYSRAVQGLANCITHYPNIRHLWIRRIIGLRQKTCPRSSRPWFLLRWLEGMIYKRRAHRQRVFLTLRAAWTGLLEGGTLPEVFFASLDFADVLVCHRRLSEASDRLRDAARAIKDSTLEREILAELRFLTAMQLSGLTHENLMKARDALYRRLFLEGSLT